MQREVDKKENLSLESLKGLEILEKYRLVIWFVI